MAQQRTVAVSVKLLASDYFVGLRKMQDETKKTAQTAEQSFNRMKASYTALGTGLAATSVVFAGAFVAMVKASADFEQRMSQVQALSKATASQMSRLRDSAFTAGKAFGLSATQVADAQIELTKAGVSVRDIIGGALPGALALAAAGQIDVAKATEIASNAMTEFKLKGSDVPHVADLLAASADKSVASVESVGDALNQSGLVAAQFGLSIEDTVGTLTAFSKAGLNGSDAGTSFKTMLTQLANPSKQAAAELEKYNIQTYDAQGNFVGITSLAQQLHDKLGGLPSVYGKVSQAQRNQALATIFGTDAIRAASALYDLGGKKLQGFIDANNEAGFATLQASKKLDNLNGDVQKLGATLQNDLIKSGSAANDVLRFSTKSASGLLEVFGDLPKPIQGTALGIAGVGAAVTATGAAFLLLTPKIAATKAAMADLNITGKGAALTFAKGAGLSLGVTAIAAGFAGLAQQGQATEESLAKTAQSARNNFTGLDKLFTSTTFGGAGAGLKNALDFEGVGSGAAKFASLNGSIGILSETVLKNEGTFNALGQQLASLAQKDLPSAQQAFAGIAKQYNLSADQQAKLLDLAGPYRDEIAKQLGQTHVQVNAQNELNGALGKGAAGQALAAAAARDAAAASIKNQQALDRMAGSATDAKVDVNALSQAIKGYGSTTLDARSAQRDFEQAVDDARAATKKAGNVLSDSTEADRAKQRTLDGVASTAIAVAAAFAKQPGGVKKAEAALESGREKFVDIATAMTGSKKKAEELADQLGLIPSNVKTSYVLAGADAAENAIQNVKDLLNGIPRYLRTQVSVNTIQNGNFNGTGPLLTKAAGGSITGPGAKGKDSVLAYLAPGEHVLTARDVDKMGGQSAVYAFRKGLEGYAAGGAIGESDAAGRRYAADATRYAKQLTEAKRAASRAEKAYSDIDGTKKNRAAKKAAKARQDAADKRVDQIEKRLDDAKQKRDTARSAAATLRISREDFVSSQRRATASNPIDPLAFVDQLRSMSRDDNYSKARRKTFGDEANRYERAIVTQTAALTKATTSLNDFKSAADSMKGSIASAIAGQYGVGNISAVGGPVSSVMRNGIKFTTTGSGYTAGGIDSFFSKGAASTASFTAQLEQLAKRGVNPAFLAEIAQDQNGAQLATALLSGTSGQIASINANYAAIQGNAAAAAGTVTDYNYAALISDAQKNADQITGQLATEGEKLRKLIASAFGLTGYAIGTLSATPGWHLVGEQGPELLRLGGGEEIRTTARTRSMMAAAASSQGASAARPSTVTIIDADGALIGHFSTAARKISRQEIAANSHLESVLLYGGAA